MHLRPEGGLVLKKPTAPAIRFEKRYFGSAVIDWMGIRRTGRYGIWIGTAASVRLDVEGLDHLAPLLGVVGDELAEVGGRADKRCASEIGEPGLDFGIGEAGVNFLIELVNNLRRCVLGRAEAG